LSGFWINLPIKLNKFDMSNLTKFNLKFYPNQQFTKLTHETGPGGADLEKMKQSQQSPCYKHKIHQGRKKQILQATILTNKIPRTLASSSSQPNQTYTRKSPATSWEPLRYAPFGNWTTFTTCPLLISLKYMFCIIINSCKRA
jgi:hypothetical protein